MAPYDTSNIFAKILRGEVPCEKVYEDDFVLSFPDRFPKAKIHVLTIPKGQFTNLYTFLKQASSLEILGFIRGIRNTLNQLALKPYLLINNSGSGPHAKQEVMHLHFHLMSKDRSKDPDFEAFLGSFARSNFELDPSWKSLGDFIEAANDDELINFWKQVLNISASTGFNLFFDSEAPSIKLDYSKTGA